MNDFKNLLQSDSPDPADDLELFRETLDDVQPIEQNQAQPFKKKLAPKPLEQPKKEDEDLADLAMETPEFLEFRKPGVQIRVFEDLRRGVIEPEATLDLHGMRVTDAKKAFLRFFEQALHNGKRCIRIIHGKGRGSANQQPVLKQKTHQWLHQREEVLAYHTAPRWDGGTGAVYVLLGRKYAKFR